MIFMRIINYRNSVVLWKLKNKRILMNDSFHTKETGAVKVS